MATHYFEVDLPDHELITSPSVSSSNYFECVLPCNPQKKPTVAMHLSRFQYLIIDEIMTPSSSLSSPFESGLGINIGSAQYALSSDLTLK